MSRHRPIAERTGTASGFSLIELLVSLAVIVILAAIIIPVVGNVRGSAHMAQCQSNLRQLSAALIMNASENGGLLPAVWVAQNNDWLNVIWKDLYASEFPYTEHKDRLLRSAFICPAAPLKDQVPSVGYGINRDITRQQSGLLAQEKTTPVLNIADPSKTCLLIENGNQVAGGNGPTSNRFTELRAAVQNRHGNRANVAFHDGHVAMYELDDIPARYDTDAGKVFWLGQ